MSNGSELRQTLIDLGLTQAELAREMVALGDDRSVAVVARQIRRMLAGDVRISGEMRALLGLMAKTRS